jgi:hypothetical protein
MLQMKPILLIALKSQSLTYLKDRDHRFAEHRIPKHVLFSFRSSYQVLKVLRSNAGFTQLPVSSFALEVYSQFFHPNLFAVHF